ncbi:cobalamin biosynthesis protein CbiG [Thermodesulfobacteriota bacterium]
MRAFDAYLMVDWSAASTAKTGETSIWYCLRTRDTQLDLDRTCNPPTRHQAMKEIKELLVALSDRGIVTLVGFDFPYSYPIGFSEALGLAEGPRWKGIWKKITSLITDTAKNGNNRFQVASALNKRITGQKGPFWGCPATEVTKFLSTRKSDSMQPEALAEFRITESRRNGLKSVWQLYYNGSVGSQALMGIPYLLALRADPRLSEVSTVWPFETGFCSLNSESLSGRLIVHAEIYPSLIQAKVPTGQVKDQAQVEALAEYFSTLDAENRLAGLFDAPEGLSDNERIAAESAEGWILGMP